MAAAYSSSEEDENRVVKSKKDSRFDELRQIVNRMRNHQKIDDWASVAKDFDDIQKVCRDDGEPRATRMCSRVRTMRVGKGGGKKAKGGDGGGGGMGSLRGLETCMVSRLYSHSKCVETQPHIHGRGLKCRMQERTRGAPGQLG